MFHLQSIARVLIVNTEVLTAQSSRNRLTIVLTLDIVVFSHEVIVNLSEERLLIRSVGILTYPVIREMLVMYHQDKMFGAGWYTPFGTFETAHNYLINIIGWTGYTGFAVISVSSLLLLIQIIRNHERIFEDQWMLCILICIWIISLLDQGILGTTNSPFVYLFYLIAGYLSSPFFKRDTLTTNQLQINS